MDMNEHEENGPRLQGGIHLQYDKYYVVTKQVFLNSKG